MWPHERLLKICRIEGASMKKNTLNVVKKDLLRRKIKEYFSDPQKHTAIIKADIGDHKTIWKVTRDKKDFKVIEVNTHKELFTLSEANNVHSFNNFDIDKILATLEDKKQVFLQEPPPSQGEVWSVKKTGPDKYEVKHGNMRWSGAPRPIPQEQVQQLLTNLSQEPNGWELVSPVKESKSFRKKVLEKIEPKDLKKLIKEKKMFLEAIPPSGYAPTSDYKKLSTQWTQADAAKDHVALSKLTQDISNHIKGLQWELGELGNLTGVTTGEIDKTTAGHQVRTGATRRAGMPALSAVNSGRIREANEEEEPGIEKEPVSKEPIFPEKEQPTEKQDMARMRLKRLISNKPLKNIDIFEDETGFHVILTLGGLENNVDIKSSPDGKMSYSLGDLSYTLK